MTLTVDKPQQRGIISQQRDVWKSEISISAAPAAVMPSAAAVEPLTLASLLRALSASLDLVEGQEMGHAVRTCLIGLRIADVLGLSQADQANLHLVLLLKDAGCSSNSARMYAIFGGDEMAAKREGKFCDWCSQAASVRYAVKCVAPGQPLRERARKLAALARLPGRVMDSLTESRCTRGAAITARLGLAPCIGEAIFHLDEHWNGRGAPRGVRGSAIPLFSRIACLAQTLEVFATAAGVSRAFEIARLRSGKWFDPAVVRAAQSFQDDPVFWQNVQDAPHPLLRQHPTQEILRASPLTDASLDNVCDAFADIVDAKSPYTADHSQRVAEFALQIARYRGLSEARCATLRRAALLHDLGKLGVPNHILEKPGKLTSDEMAVIRQHPASTARILYQVPAFHRLAQIAAAHHEKLDGTGYHCGLSASDLDEEMRILAVADIYDALTADRPYRPALCPQTALEILHKDANRTLDGQSIRALQELA